MSACAMSAYAISTRSRDMGLTGGFVLLGVGLALILLGRPRNGEDIRPFLRSSPAQVLYPALCLVFLSVGAAVVLTHL